MNSENVSVPVTLFAEDGLTVKSRYFVNNDGKENGLMTKFYPSGAVKEIVNYVNGVRNGHSVCYHENGKLQGNCTFVNGKIHGLFQVFDKEGAVVVNMNCDMASIF